MIMTKEEVDRALYADPLLNRPFPTLTEKQLSTLKSLRGLEYSESIREHFIRGAEIYSSLRQSLDALRGRENIRKQLEDKGYAERVVLVDATDDDDDDDDVPVDGATDDEDAPVGGATDDITRRAKL